VQCSTLPSDQQHRVICCFYTHSANILTQLFCVNKTTYVPGIFCDSRWMRKAARRWAGWSWKDWRSSSVIRTPPSGRPSRPDAWVWTRRWTRSQISPSVAAQTRRRRLSYTERDTWTLTTTNHTPVSAVSARTDTTLSDWQVSTDMKINWRQWLNCSARDGGSLFGGALIIP